MDNDQIRGDIGKLSAELAKLKEEIKLAAEKLPELPPGALSKEAREQLQRLGLLGHAMIPLKSARELLQWVSKRLDGPLRRAEELRKQLQDSGHLGS
jgi:hypothetical protein